MIITYPPDYNHLTLSLGISVLTYPITNAKVLIQLGHEPLSPYLTKDLFGRSVGCYPNVFSYLGHMKKEFGLSSWYKGLPAKICEILIMAAVSCRVSQKLRENYPSLTLKEIVALRGKQRPAPEELIYSAKAPLLYSNSNADGEELVADEQKLWEAFYIEMARESLCHVAAVVASQPFHVICVRMIADYVGREYNYSGLFPSIAQIWNNEGLPGFFNGLAPRMIGELLTFWISYTGAYFANKYILQNSEELQNYTISIAGILANIFTYPYMLVANVMAISGASGLKAGRPPHMLWYKSWFDCWNHLSAQNQLKRGSQLFWRTLPAIKNIDYSTLD